jgi:uncharacterized protein
VVRRFAVGLAVAALAVLVLTVPAWGHVSVSPSTATAGGFTTLTFQVPNEMDNATTTKVEVTFPKGQPIADASVQPVTGWTIKVNTSKLTTPITTDEGDSLDEGVSSIVWTASGDAAIQPGQFQQFRVSVGLPDFEGDLVFPTAQTYSNGQTVNWVEQTPAGGPEPEHPAPTVTLSKGGGDDHAGTTPTTVASHDGSNAASATNLATKDDVDSAKTVGYIAIAVGVVGLIVAVLALIMGRKRPTSTT